MPRDRPPFRADQVGSLLRPPELLEAREGFAAGHISTGELRAVEDNASERNRRRGGAERFDFIEESPAVEELISSGAKGAGAGGG